MTGKNIEMYFSLHRIFCQKLQTFETALKTIFFAQNFRLNLYVRVENSKQSLSL